MAATPLSRMPATTLNPYSHCCSASLATQPWNVRHHFNWCRQAPIKGFSRHSISVRIRECRPLCPGCLVERAMTRSTEVGMEEKLVVQRPFFLIKYVVSNFETEYPNIRIPKCYSHHFSHIQCTYTCVPLERWVAKWKGNLFWLRSTRHLYFRRLKMSPCLLLLAQHMLEFFDLSE